MNTEKIYKKHLQENNKKFHLEPLQNASSQTKSRSMQNIFIDYSLIVVAAVCITAAIVYKMQSIYADRVNQSSPLLDFVFK